MKIFDVQAIDLNVPRSSAFAFVADPAQLPRWTNAFSSIAGDRAVMRTPDGEIEIALNVQSSDKHGTVDWEMIFPDGSSATAFSRIVGIAPDRCILSFVLTPPPVALEQLEGTLAAQSQTLSEELKRLKSILEHDG